jgi:TRAP-type mannitol/chloroaromatic compound transport system substrate-binding protein
MKGEGIMKRILTCLLFVSIVSVAFTISTGKAFAAKRVKLTVQLLAFGDMSWWAEQVRIASDGNIDLVLYKPGQRASDLEILDVVSSGKVDAVISDGGSFAKVLPAGLVFTSLPFGPETDEYMAWYYYGNGAKLHQWAHDQAGFNVKVMPVTMIASQASGWFKKPIKSPSDLKGMKMRFYGLGGKTMEKLGISVMLLPGDETYSALEKGEIDATEFSMPQWDYLFGFYKIAKYNYFTGWHQPASLITFYINKDTWNSISKSQQKIIELACMAHLTNSIAQFEAAQGGVIKDNAEKRGVNNMYWSDEMLQAFKNAWQEVAAEMCAKDPVFKRCFDDLQEFRAEYKYWQNLGFLPRNCK